MLHNFCYLIEDIWDMQVQNAEQHEEFVDDDRMARRLGPQKRQHIAEALINF